MILEAVNLTFKDKGFAYSIEEIKFEEGQKVEKGQLLIAVDKSKLEASLAQASQDL